MVIEPLEGADEINEIQLSQNPIDQLQNQQQVYYHHQNDQQWYYPSYQYPQYPQNDFQSPQNDFHSPQNDFHSPPILTNSYDQNLFFYYNQQQHHYFSPPANPIVHRQSPPIAGGFPQEYYLSPTSSTGSLGVRNFNAKTSSSKNHRADYQQFHQHKPQQHVHHRTSLSTSQRDTTAERSNGFTSHGGEEKKYTKTSPSMGAKVLNSKNVYIRGLASDMTDKSFLELCERFGKVVSSKAILDLQSCACKGYGFVMYEKEEDSKIALLQFEKLGYQSSYAKTSATPVVGEESFNNKLKSLQDPNSTNIYISNLPIDLQDDDLQTLIEPHKIISKKILRDHFGNSKGVGFVRLETREMAQELINKLNGAQAHALLHLTAAAPYDILGGGGLPVMQVRFADSVAQKSLKVGMKNGLNCEKKKRYEGYTTQSSVDSNGGFWYPTTTETPMFYYNQDYNINGGIPVPYYHQHDGEITPSEVTDGGGEEVVNDVGEMMGEMEL